MDIGAFDFSDGLTYVTLSRVPEFKNTAIVTEASDEFSTLGLEVNVRWQRIHKMCCTPGMELRRKENARLVEFAKKIQRWVDELPEPHHLFRP